MSPNNDPIYGEIDLGLYALRPGVYEVDLRVNDPENDAAVTPARGLAEIDFDKLLDLQLSPNDYGVALASMVFQDAAIRNLYLATKAAFDARGYFLRLRISIDAATQALHGVRWELLCDPLTNHPLGASERILFSRFLSSDDWRTVKLRPKSNLKAVIAVAAPIDWARQGLAEVDKAGETQRAKYALGLPNCAVAAEEGDPLTLTRLIDALRDGADILYLVCHGMKPKDGVPCLFLQKDDGSTGRVLAPEIAQRIRDLPQPPRLVVLASCESALAGDAAFEAHPALAPLLAGAGVPAIIAMQGKISVDSVRIAMPVFFRELMKDGAIDRAMAAARGEIRNRYDAWMPALFMRLKSGRIWYEPNFTGAAKDPLETWKDIVRNIRNGNCIPILGPDLGEQIFGPFTEVARKMAFENKLPLPDHAASDLAKVTQYIVMDHKRLGTEDRLRETLGRSIGGAANAQQFRVQLDRVAAERLQDPNDPYRILADLPAKIFVNASPETTLLRVLKANGKTPEPLACAWRDHPSEPKPKNDPSPDSPCVYHVFGAFELQDSLVLTEDDFFDYVIATSTYKLIPAAVRSGLTKSSLLFLGFRLDDWTFRVLFRLIMALEGSEQMRLRPHVGVQVSPGDLSIKDVQRAREYLGKYFARNFVVRSEPSIDIYWGSSADFLRELRDRMLEAPPLEAVATPQTDAAWF